MRTLAFIATILASAIALAFPAVNDQAKLSGQSITAGGQAMPVSIEFELVGFDSRAATFRQKTTVVAAGQTDVQEAWVSQSDLLSTEMTARILQNCLAVGGQMDAITTPAGRFNACALPTENDVESGIYWIADVPFGIVRVLTTSKADGTKTELTLQSFRKGN